MNDTKDEELVDQEPIREETNEDEKQDKDTKFSDDEKKENADAKNIYIDGIDNFAQSDGVQFNFFNKSESSNLKKYRFSMKELIECCSDIYILPDYKYRGEATLYKYHILMLCGEQGIGRYSIAQCILSNMKLEKVISVTELTKEQFEGFEWDNNTGYIIEHMNGEKGLNRIYCQELSNVLNKMGSYLILIVLNHDSKLLEIDLKKYFLEIDLSLSKEEIIKKHIINKANESAGIGFSEKNIVEFLDSQLKSNIFYTKLDEIKEVDQLVRLSHYLYDAMVKSECILNDDEIISLFRELEITEEWIDLIEGLSNIQEKVFLLTCSCLSGMVSDMIYQQYRLLEQVLVHLLSKREQEQVEDNEFGSKTWNEKLLVFRKYIKSIDKQIGHDPHSYARVITMNEKDSKRILCYFLEQYEWYFCIKTWLISVADQCKEKEEFDIVSRALAKMPNVYIDDILSSIHNQYVESSMSEQYRINSMVILMSCYMRYLYELQEKEIKRKVLITLHENLVSKKSSNNFMGAMVYYYGFSDIHLNKIYDDLINLYKSGFTISCVCIFETAYEQDESAGQKESIIYFLLRDEELWNEQHIDLIRYILKKLFKTNKGKWSRNKKGVNVYPFILYLYGMNKNVRDDLCKLVIKGLNFYMIKKQTLQLISDLFTYVQKNKESGSLQMLYEDFIEDIIQRDSFSKSLINGVHTHYFLMNNTKEKKDEF